MELLAVAALGVVLLHNRQQAPGSVFELDQQINSYIQQRPGNSTVGHIKNQTVDTVVNNLNLTRQNLVPARSVGDEARVFTAGEEGMEWVARLFGTDLGKQKLQTIVEERPVIFNANGERLYNPVLWQR